MRRPPLQVQLQSSNFDDSYTKNAVDIVIQDERIREKLTVTNPKRSLSLPLKQKQLIPQKNVQRTYTMFFKRTFIQTHDDAKADQNVDN